MRSVHQKTIFFKGGAFEIFSLFADQPHAFFLDSSLHRSRGRFSYIGFSPFKTVRRWDDLRREYSKHRLKSKSSFPAGAVGYLGYDGSVHFGFYGTVLAIDHVQKQLSVSSFFKGALKDVLRPIQAGLSAARARGRHRYPSGKGNTVALPGRVTVSGSARPGPVDGRKFLVKSNFTKAQYMNAVRKALGHIRRGDIYQINLSHQIKVPLSVEPMVLYENLRRAFPSEFGAYLDDGQQVILSASPERFLKYQNGMVQVRPMKGTRPRGRTKREDAALKTELHKSPKEIAELLMVTDLERNDLGRVCDYGSVKVATMRAIETYSSVFQATSAIEGRLREDRDPFDLLKATFPSGSVTGCPKIEAMKIIDQLEHGPRGLYTGALGYISFTGDMDFNVMIRTMFVKGKEIAFHVGGGIVADSRPAAEWQETWDKARPLMAALYQSL